jgi:hypothetical protein
MYKFRTPKYLPTCNFRSSDYSATYKFRTHPAACKEHADGFGVNYIAQHDCATRRGNNFRRRNTNLRGQLMAKIGSPEQREEYF